jgi:hypothetical protein
LDAPAAFEIALHTAVALVFLEAAYGKFADRAGFEGVVANYRLLPERLVGALANMLPPLEALIGGWLLTGLGALWASAAAAALLALFAAAMGVNLLRGRREIDCGCGRAGLRQPIGWGRVARNLILGVLLLGAGDMRGAGLGDWALGLAAGAVVFALDYTLSYLSSLAPRRLQEVRR